MPVRHASRTEMAPRRPRAQDLGTGARLQDAMPGRRLLVRRQLVHRPLHVVVDGHRPAPLCGGQPVSLPFVTHTAAAAARLEESRNVGELAGGVGGVAVLAGEAGQVHDGLVEDGEGLVEFAARPGEVGGA